MSPEMAGPPTAAPGPRSPRARWGGRLAWEGSGRKATEAPSGPTARDSEKRLSDVITCTHFPISWFPATSARAPADTLVGRISKFSGSSIPPPLGSPAHHDALSNIYGWDPSLSKYLREGSKGPNAIEPWARPPSPTPAGCVSGHKNLWTTGPGSSSHHHRPQRPAPTSQHSPGEAGTRLPPGNLAPPRPPPPRPWGARHEADPSARSRCSPPPTGVTAEPDCPRSTAWGGIPSGGRGLPSLATEASPLGGCQHLCCGGRLQGWPDLRLLLGAARPRASRSNPPGS